MPEVTLHLGDCLEVMRAMPDGCVDAMVTDPPSGISFMSKSWDTFRCRDAFIDFLLPRLAECLRVAKPGSRALVWAIPRTSHWTATAIEDSGWIIEDRISHIFGQGFPKAKSKLKPAVEDWWVARNPSKNVPSLNIDYCRIDTGGEVLTGGTGTNGKHKGWDRPYMHDGTERKNYRSTTGRYPANLILSHSDCNGECVEGCPVAELDGQSGERPGDSPNRKLRRNQLESWRRLEGRSDRPDQTETAGFLGSGGASRFFYCPKASRSDRGQDNDHPTVKPTALMRWLCRLVTQPGDVILDPFTGSGSTGKATILEGRSFIGIEKDPSYLAIAERRIATARAATPLFA